MTPKWVIVFDWDGTLIDSLPLKIRNAGLLFSETFGVSPARIEAAYRVHSGIPRRQLFEAICADNDLPALTDEQFAALSAQFTARNRAAIVKVRVDASVISTLAALHETGWPLFISTSAAPDEVQFVAESLKLDVYFEKILGSQGEFAKGPAHIAFILERTLVSLDRIWFVGDEPNDAMLGKKAGVRTVLKRGSHPEEHLTAAKPDFLIDSLADLIPLLERS